MHFRNTVLSRDITHIKSRFIKVGGLRIHCRYSEGTGPTVVLLQGGMLDSSVLTWRRALEALPAHFRVFAPDLPGYGLSDKPDAPYTTEYFIDFLCDFMDTLGLNRANICGSSMSGAIVLGFALRHPERVGRLVLAGAYGFQHRVPLHEAAWLVFRIPGLANFTHFLLHGNPLAVRLALPVAIHDTTRITDDLVADAYAGVRYEKTLMAFITWMRSELLPHRLRSDFTPWLPRLQMPVMILHGAHDWTMPVEAARRAAARLPDAELHVFPDCGHLVPRERPEDTNRLLLEFLRPARPD